MRISYTSLLILSSKNMFFLSIISYSKHRKNTRCWQCCKGYLVIVKILILLKKKKKSCSRMIARYHFGGSCGAFWLSKLVIHDIFGAALCHFHDGRSRVHNKDGDHFFSFPLTFLSLSLEIDVSSSKNYLCSPVSISIDCSPFYFFIICFVFNIFLKFKLFSISFQCILLHLVFNPIWFVFFWLFIFLCFILFIFPHSY
jgi:hypothetical protein